MTPYRRHMTTPDISFIRTRVIFLTHFGQNFLTNTVSERTGQKDIWIRVKNVSSIIDKIGFQWDNALSIYGETKSY